jgi:hypothetical protein
LAQDRQLAPSNFDADLCAADRIILNACRRPSSLTMNQVHQFRGRTDLFSNTRPPSNVQSDSTSAHEFGSDLRATIRRSIKTGKPARTSARKLRREKLKQIFRSCHSKSRHAISHGSW